MSERNEDIPTSAADETAMLADAFASQLSLQRPIHFPYDRLPTEVKQVVVNNLPDEDRRRMCLTNRESNTLVRSAKPSVLEVNSKTAEDICKRLLGKASGKKFSIPSRDPTAAEHIIIDIPTRREPTDTMESVFDYSQEYDDRLMEQMIHFDDQGRGLFGHTSVRSLSVHINDVLLDQACSISTPEQGNALDELLKSQDEGGVSDLASELLSAFLQSKETTTTICLGLTGDAVSKLANDIPVMLRSGLSKSERDKPIQQQAHRHEHWVRGMRPSEYADFCGELDIAVHTPRARFESRSRAGAGGSRDDTICEAAEAVGIAIRNTLAVFEYGVSCGLKEDLWHLPSRPCVTLIDCSERSVHSDGSVQLDFLINPQVNADGSLDRISVSFLSADESEFADRSWCNKWIAAAKKYGKPTTTSAAEWECDALQKPFHKPPRPRCVSVKVRKMESRDTCAWHYQAKAERIWDNQNGQGDMGH